MARELNTEKVSSYLMTHVSGSRVYIPDPDHSWLPACVQSIREGRYISLEIEDVPSDGSFVSPSELSLGQVVGQLREIDLKDIGLQKIVANRSTQNNKDDGNALPLQNKYLDANGVADMITLDYLHEGAILYNLRHRFFRKMPYTYTGQICIAVNPYQWLNLYDNEKKQIYSKGGRETDASPHIYATSRDAYKKMRLNNLNQSILVSGESGAGK